MDLHAYLQRINYSGPVDVSLETLRQIHHQHLLHIPYENLDVQLRQPLDLDPQRIFNKLVTARRGGWCYEMNGLLGWALQEIGFNVMRMSGAVNRAGMGDGQLANHLILEVILDQPYMADVGLGDGLREPVPISAGQYTQGGLSYRLEKLPDGFWRFHNHKFSNVASFDFRHEAADENALAAKCRWLQEAEESPFRMLLIAQRFTPEGIHVQLGKVAAYITSTGKQTTEAETLRDLQQRLEDNFDLRVDVTELWPAIEKAHRYFKSGQ